MNEKDFLVLIGSIWVAPMTPDLINVFAGTACATLFLILCFKKD